MLTCPWCGTNYATFQSNCKNCGGPLPLPAEKVPSESDEILPSPPLAPRPISDSYAWRLLSADGAAITGFVFLLLGLVFTLVGTGLTLGRVTAFVGIPFAIIGPLFLIVGLALGFWRYGQARQVIQVLREGQATEGQIIGVQENYSVRVNNRHPWLIRYQFQMSGRTFEGRVTTLNTPGAGLQAGKKAFVLYLPNAPEHNVLYPHP
ncbi:MAG: DUF3592 domain-containing protein [Anaerolineae bacterium]